MRPFRFGLVAAPRGTREQWVATGHRALDRGFGTLLAPDGLGLHAPLPALATVAAAVPGLRVGPFVLAAPMRPPQVAAWEGHSMTVLTDGRFEFGVGTGRPDARAEVERVGRPWGSGAQRLEQVRETVAALRTLDGDGHTPVLIAAGGPRALALAAEEADIVTLAAPPATPRAEVARMASQARTGGRDPELSMNVFVVGDEVPAWAARMIGDPAALPDDTLARLRGTPRQMADELLRRRDELGVSYVAVGEAFVEAFAPVVELLAGR
jgi:alkanesulfonate monooxygenase SsuD/methylene tetrahydromethanopterin reductase-like flavin-dependent oxidoreductase (luciferase family)